MADLLQFQRFLPADGGPDIGPTPVLNLYCWPCRTVHTIEVADVERIVYALAVDVVHQRDAERVVPDVPEDFDPPCLLLALESGNTGDLYGETADEGVECRAASHDA